MFERFTERARQVVIFAQDEARALKSNHIGTEHLLLGLLREEEGLAARVLDSLDVTLDEVHDRILTGTFESTTGQIPFTPRAKKALNLAMREAISLGHNYIGTEHILLGLVRNECEARLILSNLNIDAVKIRDEIMRMLSGPSSNKKVVVSKDTAKIKPKPAMEIFHTPRGYAIVMPNGDFWAFDKTRRKQFSEFMASQALGLMDGKNDPSFDDTDWAYENIVEPFYTKKDAQND
jgi:ATP-dependent Clp protease ATP-binding subunit ClpC